MSEKTQLELSALCDYLRGRRLDGAEASGLLAAALGHIIARNVIGAEELPDIVARLAETTTAQALHDLHERELMRRAN